MDRYLKKQILSDLKQKMVFLGGPRQVGKTTLAQSISPREAYLNWDSADDRQRILSEELPRSSIWVFDEIHKYKKWRNYLKGLFDKNKQEKKILVTGSARLDLYRRGGDSLQGRYHYLRLHPLTLDELKVFDFKTLDSLLNLGGFPEPFLRGNKIDAKRWSNQYRERILRDDISSIETIEDLGSAERLLLRLPDLVASPLSINALKEDLQVDFKTVKKWLEIFENFYAIFRIFPFGAPQIKAVKKENKHYHFDWTLVKDAGARFENLIASHLLKWVHFGYDTQGRNLELQFYKDRERREVDFVVTEDKRPLFFVECKTSDKSVSGSFNYLVKKFPNCKAYQLTLEDVGDFQNSFGVRVVQAHKGLREIYQLLGTSN